MIKSSWRPHTAENHGGQGWQQCTAFWEYTPASRINKMSTVQMQIDFWTKNLAHTCIPNWSVCWIFFFSPHVFSQPKLSLVPEICFFSNRNPSFSKYPSQTTSSWFVVDPVRDLLSSINTNKSSSSYNSVLEHYRSSHLGKLELPLCFWYHFTLYYDILVSHHPQSRVSQHFQGQLYTKTESNINGNKVKL